MTSTHRSASYTNEENIHLCHVYLDISQNSITWFNQSRGQFWSKIEADYHLEQAFATKPRPKRSLQCRIQIINSVVAKLRVCVQQVKNLSPSGEDKKSF